MQQGTIRRIRVTAITSRTVDGAEVIAPSSVVGEEGERKVGVWVYLEIRNGAWSGAVLMWESSVFKSLENHGCYIRG